MNGYVSLLLSVVSPLPPSLPPCLPLSPLSLSVCKSQSMYAFMYIWLWLCLCERFCLFLCVALQMFGANELNIKWTFTMTLCKPVMDTYIHLYIKLHTCAYIHYTEIHTMKINDVCIKFSVHTYTHIWTHAYTHAHTRTCTHKHAHKHTYI